MKAKFVNHGGRAIKTVKVIASELKRIQAEQSVVTPQAVVEAARPKTSPLHRYFEWDNTKAAENYRKWQARELILSVYIQDDDDPDAGPVRAFVNLTPEKDCDFIAGKGYVFTPTIASKANYQQQVLEYALGQIHSWREKFGNIKQFFGIVKEIDKLSNSKITVR